MLECSPREETKIKRPCWGILGRKKKTRANHEIGTSLPLCLPPEPLVCHVSGGRVRRSWRFVFAGSIAASGFSSFLVARQSTAPRGQGLDQWYRALWLTSGQKQAIDRQHVVISASCKVAWKLN